MVLKELLYKKNDMLSGPVLKSLLIFALPILISNIFQQLYNTVDTIVIGNYLGDMSIAALGASMAVFQLLVGFALGFGNGFGIVIARFFGAGDEERIKHSVANGLIIGVMFLYNLGAGLLRAIGNSMMPLVFLIISSLLNIGLDILFVIGLDYGIKGAAIATIISQGVSVVLVFIYIVMKAPILVPSLRHFKIDLTIMKDLAGQGLSMALMSSLVIVGTVILQYAINNMGYQIIAGHTVARRIHSLLLLPIIALVYAISTFVSQNKGANQSERIRKAVRYQFLLCIGWGLIIGIFTWNFSYKMIGGFSGTTDSLVLKTGSNYLRFNTPFYGLVGVVLTTRFALQGLGEKIKPLASSIIELVLKFVFVIIIIPKIGYTGVIISEPIIWVFMAIELLYAYYKHPFIAKNKQA